MGLAAAQARLLTITARKSDCVFESMQLSHQKIALARDMENISQEYQEALSDTSLVYDYYGSGAKALDLSYGLLMKPSIYNDYYPKLLTDTQNRVVLDGAIAAAAKYAGVPSEGLLGTPSSDVRDAFIEGLYNAGVISLTTGNNILNTEYGYTIGLGDMVTVNTVVEDITYDDLLKVIKDSTLSSGEYGFVMGTQSNVMDATIQVVDSSDSSTTAFSAKTYEMVWTSTKGTKNTQFIGYDYDTEMYNDIKKRTNNTNVDMNLYDLLTDENTYSMVMMSPAGYITPLNEVAYLQNAVVGDGDSASFLNWLSDQFLSVLGSTEQNTMAVQYAYDTVRNIIYPDDDVINAAYDMQSTLKRILTLKPKKDDIGAATTTYMSNTQKYKSTGQNSSTLCYMGDWKSEERTAYYRNRASWGDNVTVTTYDDNGDWSMSYTIDGKYNDKKYTDIIKNAATKVTSGLYDGLSATSKGYTVNAQGVPIPNSATKDSSTVTSNATKLGENAVNNVGLVYYRSESGNGSGAAVNLNNLAKVFLTALVDYNEGLQYNYKYSKGSIAEKDGINNLYSSKKDDTPFTIAYSDADQSEGALEAHFYDALLNQISINGWTMNNNIDDPEYMQNMLKNGMMYISSITEDGLYLQENYANDKYINEKANDEKIAKAEAKYNTEKAKIESKEQTLDMKLKRLDAEVSSLSTEYDTVKSLIKTNIDKGFKRYDA